ncbi:polypeptide N-acetylgalactosaminyltransferase 1-like [Haliotis asinina]|uniref:polypeptide N-acetylgalactosaminyltransferase 1-like n=1 Tax=Haliotis asinina TaxID=109174 RepID=UPI0035322387
MARQGAIFLWTSFVVFWFAFYIFCLFLFLTTGPNREKEDITGKPKHVRAVRPHQKSGVASTTQDKNNGNAQMHYRALLDSNPSHKEELLRRTRHYLLKTRNLSSSDSFGFNVDVSDTVPVLRQLPDTRPDDCKKSGYNLSTLPTVTVVSPMYNEALSTLLRHVHSLLARTPKELLKEIIIVDDKSEHAYLDKRLDDYFRILDSRVNIIRNTQRQGLSWSRMKGASFATGEIIVFLDSHMEVNIGWLEPLLDELLKGGPTTVVQPDVVSVDSKTFEFSEAKEATFVGGFGWDLRYSWFFKPDYLQQVLRTMADPIPTPVLVGCAIAVWREHFMSTGGFDTELQIWGGEHLELSFKTWMTGGRILTVPCSKIGHVFKSGTFHFGSDFQDIVRKNLMRVAEVWMDEYKEIFMATQRYGTTLPNFTVSEIESIEERKRLRQRLRSKPFRWFLKVITPDMKIPTKDAVNYGEIENALSSTCVTATPSGVLTLTSRCFRHRVLPENQFTIDKHGQFIHDGKCIVPATERSILRETVCSCNGSRGQWVLNPGPAWGHIEFSIGHNLVYCVVPRRMNGMMVLTLERCSHVGDREDSYWSFQYHLQYSEDASHLGFLAT